MARRRERGRAPGVTAADDQHVEFHHGRPSPQAVTAFLSKWTGVQTEQSAEERNWAMAAHLSALIAVAGLPFGHVIGPLVVYLIKGHESPFVAEHARASLNYQLTISLFGLVAILVGVFGFFGFIFAAASQPAHSTGSAAMGIGFVGAWVLVGAIVVALLLLSLVFIIMGTLAAGAGRPYSYPFAIRFVK